jgi:hypothetical protein
LELCPADSAGFSPALRKQPWKAVQGFAGQITAYNGGLLGVTTSPELSVSFFFKKEHERIILIIG